MKARTLFVTVLAVVAFISAARAGEVYITNYAMDVDLTVYDGVVPGSPLGAWSPIGGAGPLDSVTLNFTDGRLLLWLSGPDLARSLFVHDGDAIIILQSGATGAYEVTHITRPSHYEFSAHIIALGVVILALLSILLAKHFAK